jgi:gliding motility-associated-like protein
MDEILVNYRNCDPLISVPNAFTPNNDGRNDSFRAVGVNITNYRMQLFDRWGELIFTSDDPGVGWDGTKNGASCSNDIYVWSIYYESDALEEKVKEMIHGTVVLIR